MANMNSLTEANQSIIYLFFKEKKKKQQKQQQKLLINILKGGKSENIFY